MMTEIFEELSAIGDSIDKEDRVERLLTSLYRIHISLVLDKSTKNT